MSSCSTQHLVVESSGATILNTTIDDEGLDVLSELSLHEFESVSVQSSSPLGPQLIAGDWLAWQCADAGDYWNLPAKNAPTFLYAGAYEAEMSGSDFEY